MVSDSNPDSESRCSCSLVWRDKCDRLETTLVDVQRKNHTLEDKLIHIIEKSEADKLSLSSEVDELNERLQKALARVAELERDCEKYKSDCQLAVTLLECRHITTGPSLSEKEKYKSDCQLAVTLLECRHITTGPSLSEKVQRQSSTPIISRNTSLATFPPMAMIFHENEEEVRKVTPSDALQNLKENLAGTEEGDTVTVHCHNIQEL